MNLERILTWMVAMLGNATTSLFLIGLYGASATWAQQLPKAMQETEIRAAGGIQIRGPELKQMLIGNTAYSIFLRNINSSKAGDVIVSYYRDDKTRMVQWPNRHTYQSNIWFEGDALCVEQRGGTGAGHQCYSAWNVGNVAYNCALPGGDCLIAFRMIPGNPEGL